MKIFILGPSGAGTTTLGRKIAGEFGIAHQDSDDLFWEPTDPPFTTPRDAESLREKFYSLVSTPSFVLSGDVLNWGLHETETLNSFTHLIYLYAPWPIREQRIRLREKQRFAARIAAGGDMHEAHEAFIEWASHYESGLLPGRNMSSQKEYISRFRNAGKPVLEIESPLSLPQTFDLSLEFCLTTSP